MPSVVDDTQASLGRNNHYNSDNIASLRRSVVLGDQH